MYLLLKALLSGAIIAVASEVARRSSLLAALLISLPLTSILAFIWLYRDTRDANEVAALSWSILWLIVPSLVFFVVLPLAIRGGSRVRHRVADGLRGDSAQLWPLGLDDATLRPRHLIRRLSSD